MEFGKSLSTQIEKTLPEWRDKFLSYKELKKKLKSLDPITAASDDRLAKRLILDFVSDSGDMSNEEKDFRNLLEIELEKFNNFFVEKEEEYIIRLKQQKVIITNKYGIKLVGILHEAETKEIVILCHGLQASKEEIIMTQLAAALEDAGISFFLFDLTGNGKLQMLHNCGDSSRLVVIYEQCMYAFWHSEQSKDDLRYLKVWLKYIIALIRK